LAAFAGSRAFRDHFFFFFAAPTALLLLPFLFLLLLFSPLLLVMDSRGASPPVERFPHSYERIIFSSPVEQSRNLPQTPTRISTPYTSPFPAREVIFLNFILVFSLSHFFFFL
jgi:hypothetical protein